MLDKYFLPYKSAIATFYILKLPLFASMRQCLCSNFKFSSSKLHSDKQKSQALSTELIIRLEDIIPSKFTH